MKQLSAALGLGLFLAFTAPMAVGQTNRLVEQSSSSSQDSGFMQSDLFQALGQSTKESDTQKSEQSFKVLSVSSADKGLVLTLQAGPEGQYFIEPSSVKVSIEGATIAQEQAYTKLEKQTGTFELAVAVETLAAGVHELQLSYQGCTQAGVCLPPAQISYDFQTEKAISPSLWGKAGTLLILGLLLGLSPCVLPIAPIVVSSLSGKDARLGKKVSSSLLFLGSMALAYAVLGAIAGLSGAGLSGLLQTLPVRLIFAAFMVWIAYRTFNGRYGSGFNPPAFMAKWLDQVNGKGPGAAQAIASGVLSAFVVSPCVSGPLAGILAFIAQHADPVRGGIWLAVFCLGMGFPIVVCAALTITRIKASVWMQWANELSALLLVCMAALTVLGNQGIFLPLALMLTTVYLFQKLTFSSKQLNFTQRAVLTCAIGVLTPFTILQVLPVLPQSGAQSTAGQQAPLTSAEFAAKKAVGFPDKGLNIYFVTAKWCATCSELKKGELSAQSLNELFGKDKYSLQLVDVSENNEKDQAMLKAEGLFGPPAVYFVYEGKVLEQFTGKIEAQRLKNLAKQIQGLESQAGAKS